MSDFRALHQTLSRTKQPSTALPALPGGLLPAAILTPDPVLMMEGLDNYLHFVLLNPELSILPPLDAFFGEHKDQGISYAQGRGMAGMVGDETVDHPPSLPPLLPIANRYLASMCSGGGELLCTLNLTADGSARQATLRTGAQCTARAVSGKQVSGGAEASAEVSDGRRDVWRANLLPPPVETKQLVIAAAPGRGLDLGDDIAPQLMLMLEDGGLMQHVPPSDAEVAAAESAADELTRLAERTESFSPLGALKRLLSAAIGDEMAKSREQAAAEAAKEAGAGVLPVPAFTLLKALYGKRVTRLSAGGGHVLALCVGGSADVLSWGRGAEGQLGHGVRLPEPQPRSLAKFQGKAVEGVACGALHSLVTASGSTYAFGQGIKGQLGLGDNRAQTYPQVQQGGLGAVRSSCGKMK